MTNHEIGGNESISDMRRAVLNTAQWYPQTNRQSVALRHGLSLKLLVGAPYIVESCCFVKTFDVAW